MQQNHENCRTSESLRASPTPKRSRSRGSFSIHLKHNRSSSSGHLHSLSRLEVLKHDPSIQSLKYDQAYKQHKTPETLSFSKLKKMMNLKRALIEPQKLKESPINKTSSNSNRVGLLKTRRLHSQERQILIEHYRNKTESMPQLQNLPNLDTIWHHTLSNLAQHKNASNEMIPGTFPSSLVGEDAPTQKLTETQESELQSYIEPMQRKPSTGIVLFHKKSTNAEGFYDVLIKRMEYLNKFLTDFYKTVFHLQRAYQKAQLQQEHLYNYVNAFIQEVEETEKDLKRAKISVLKTCLANVETKLIEMTEEKELLVEQTQYIQDLVESTRTINNPKVDANIDKRKTERCKTPVRALISLKKASLVRAGSDENLSIIQGGNSKFPFGWDENKETTNVLLDEPRKTPQQDNIFRKVEILNEKERMRPTTAKKQRSMSSKGKMVRGQNSMTIETNETILKPNHSKLDSVIIPKNVLKIQRSNTITSIERLESLDLNRIQSGEPNFLDQVLLDSNTTSRLCEKLEEKDSLRSAGDLYHLYQEVVEKLEEKVVKMLREMKLFQKSAEDQANQSTRLVTLQIKYFFETMLNEFQTLTVDLNSKHIQFLKDVECNLLFLQDLISSNVLKLTALRNILSDSIRKVSSINRFINNYTFLDLSDKTMRRQFTDIYQNLKINLDSDKKTLLFLSEQFNRTTAICPASSTLNEALSGLTNKAKSLLRALYNVDKLPQIEAEFNEKSLKAYSTCKSARDIIESLKEFITTKGSLSATKFQEGERILRELETTKIKITATINELGTISKLDIFNSILNNSLSLVIKQCKELIMYQKELKDVLGMIRESLILDYSQITEKTKEIYQKVNAYILKITNSSKLFSQAECEESFITTEGFKEAVNHTLNRINHYSEENYPSSIKLLPDPLEQKKSLLNCQLKIECLAKILHTKRLFGQHEISKFFTGIKVFNARSKLDGLNKIIQEEIVEKEKLTSLLEKDSDLAKKMVVETISSLLQLRFLIKKSFELQDRVAKMYNDFKESISNHSDCFLSSIFASTYNPVETFFSLNPLRKEVGVESSAQNDKIRFLVVTIPESEGLKNQFSDLLQSFVEKLKNCFKEFLDTCADSYIQEYKVCEDAVKWLKVMTEEELKLLNKVKAITEKTQANCMTYRQKIKSFTVLPKYIEILMNCGDDIQSLVAIQKTIDQDFKELKNFGGTENLQGGVDLQVEKCREVQQMILDSIEILRAIYSLGQTLNEKELQVRLGLYLRVGESRLDDYVQLIENKFSKILARYQNNTVCLEESTADMLSKLKEFFRIFCLLLKTIHDKYRKLFTITSDGLEPFKGNFLAYIESLYIIMQDLSKDFLNISSTLSGMVGSNSRLVAILEKFYKDVVVKDLNIFDKLWDQAKMTEPYIQEFMENFVSIELKQNHQYRNLKASDPSKCDQRAEEYGRIYQILNNLFTSEEILCRQELRILLSRRLKKFKVMRKIFLDFAIIYSMGRSLYNRLNPILQSRDVIEVVSLAKSLRPVIDDMTERLRRIAESTKQSDQEIELDAIKFVQIIRDDIYAFYCDFKVWIEELIENFSDLADFYSECQNRLKRQVFFLQEDRIDFLKDSISQKFYTFDKEFPSIKPTYAGLKKKLDKFVLDLKDHIMTGKVEFIEGLKRVDYLNENFFHDNFFQVCKDNTVSGDKITTKINEVISELENGDLTQGSLQETLRKITNNLTKSKKFIRDLSNYNIFKDLLLKDWDLVEEYVQERDLTSWNGLIMYIVNELMTIEGLAELTKDLDEIESQIYEQLEYKLNLKLTDRQKHFISLVYRLIKIE